ncbi:TlpA family protein disulfide reductase [Tenacibaculum halocynthiae]|uniref:TlpA family protein disulfide reductase n=1 Tax=Tenacibaculum halocynthiae TaxID=1254437 RepID=UPI003D648D94
MRIVVIVLVTLLFGSCAVFQPKKIPVKPLEEKLITINRESITLKDIFESGLKRETIIQVYASYCPFSQDSFKDVVKLQQNNKKINYVFLSVDHSYHDWKRGLETLKVKGSHYYIPKKGKGEIAKFLKLKTIPRFLLIDKNGKLKVFNTSKVSKIESKLNK